MYRDLAHCTVAYLEGFLPVREGGAAETAVALLPQGMQDVNKRLRRDIETTIGRPVRRSDVLHRTPLARELENELRWHISEKPAFGRRIRSVVMLNGLFNMILADGRLYDPELLERSERPVSLGETQSAVRPRAAARPRSNTVR